MSRLFLRQGLESEELVLALNLWTACHSLPILALQLHVTLQYLRYLYNLSAE